MTVFSLPLLPWRSRVSFPLLETGMTLCLAWPIECRRSNTVWLPRLGQRTFNLWEQVRGAWSYHIGYSTGKRETVDGFWMRSCLVEIKAMWRGPEMPDMSLKKPFWMFQLIEPSDDSTQPPSDYSNVRVPKWKQQKNYSAYASQPTDPWDVIKWLFSAANFGMICFITIDNQNR